MKVGGQCGSFVTAMTTNQIHETLQGRREVVAAFCYSRNNYEVTSLLDIVR